MSWAYYAMLDQAQFTVMPLHQSELLLITFSLQTFFETRKRGIKRRKPLAVTLSA
jgi:hypothetical protein